MTIPWPALLAIGIGAPLGAWCRWGLSIWLNPLWPRLPLGTLVANVAGGLLVGLLMAWFERHPQGTEALRLCLVTGFLGALTTFSTFSYEVIQPLQRGEPGVALLIAMAHLLLALLATYVGLRLAA
jgi:CrcB protein